MEIINITWLYTVYNIFIEDVFLAGCVRVTCHDVRTLVGG